MPSKEIKCSPAERELPAGGRALLVLDVFVRTFAWQGTLTVKASKPATIKLDGMHGVCPDRLSEELKVRDSTTGLSELEGTSALICAAACNTVQ